MGFLFGKKKNKEELIAIFDIGSGIIGGAIARIPKDDYSLPIILKSTRTEINYNKDKLNTNTFIRNMLKALDETIKDIYDMKLGAPSQIVCVLASPWYSLETRVVKTKKDSKFVFTKKIADKMIEKEIKAISGAYNNKNKTIYNEIEIIENYIIDISLNGYKIEEPIGIHTKSIEMNMVLSYSQKFFLDKIRKIISSHFHETPISFSAFMLSSYFTIRDKYVSPDSYL